MLIYIALKFVLNSTIRDAKFAPNKKKIVSNSTTKGEFSALTNSNAKNSANKVQELRI